MARRAGIDYREASNAERVLMQAASPGLEQAAELLAPEIVEKVPVHHGIAKAHTRTSASLGSARGDPQGQTWIDSPFWHFLEYGTATNPPYRPIQRAAEALGLRYQSK